MSDSTKTCTKCRVEKPVSEFGRDRSRPDGLRSRCKVCKREQQREYYAANRDELRERSRRYYETNRDELNEQHRRYHAANRDEIIEQQRQYQAGLRAAALAMYGTACACCASTRNLQIDHVFGGGRRHLKEMCGGPVAFYLWLVNGVEGGRSPAFQTLCARCNTSKHDGDRCRLDHSAA